MRMNLAHDWKPKPTQLTWVISFYLLSSLDSMAEAAKPFLGDPGDLGDAGTDLAPYTLMPRHDTGKMRPKRFLNFPLNSTARFQSKLTVPLFNDYDNYVRKSILV